MCVPCCVVRCCAGFHVLSLLAIVFRVCVLCVLCVAAWLYVLSVVVDGFAAVLLLVVCCLL